MQGGSICAKLQSANMDKIEYHLEKKFRRNYIYILKTGLATGSYLYEYVLGKSKILEILFYKRNQNNIDFLQVWKSLFSWIVYFQNSSSYKPSRKFFSRIFGVAFFLTLLLIIL